MAYYWTVDDTDALTDAAALDEVGIAQRFETQKEAELWLGATYADLLDVGATSVSLYEEGRLVYGPMSLAE